MAFPTEFRWLICDKERPEKKQHNGHGQVRRVWCRVLGCVVCGPLGTRRVSLRPKLRNPPARPCVSLGRRHHRTPYVPNRFPCFFLSPILMLSPDVRPHKRLETRGRSCTMLEDRQVPRPEQGRPRQGRGSGSGKPELCQIICCGSRGVRGCNPICRSPLIFGLFH